MWDLKQSAKKIALSLLSLTVLSIPSSLSLALDKVELPNMEGLALNIAGVTNEVLLKWVSQTVIASYSYSPANYQQQLESLKPSFTTSGYSTLLKTLQSTNNLSDALIGKGTSIATLTSPGNPAIVAREVNSMVLAWRLLVPVTVSYQDAHAQMTQNFLVTVFVNRVFPSKSNPGLAITNFFAKAV